MNDKQQINISQRHLLNQILKYLKFNNRSTEFLESTNPKEVRGHCNGFSIKFLAEVSRGNITSYIDFLKKFSKLPNFSDEEYKKIYTKNKNQYKKRFASTKDFAENFKDKIEHFINDIIYLQQNPNLLPEIYIHQKKVQDLEKVINNKDNRFIPNQYFFSDNILNLDELKNYLETLRVPGNKILIGGAGHATAFYVDKNSNICYYDPNNKYYDHNDESTKSKFSDMKALANFIQYLKFTCLQKNAINMSIIFYCFREIKQKRHISDQVLNEIIKNTTTLTSKEYAKQSENNFNILHELIIKGYYKDLEYVLDKIKINARTLLNQKDNMGRTPIFHLTHSSNYEMFKKFIAKGADIDIKDKLGCSLINYASIQDNPKIINYLFDKFTTQEKLFSLKNSVNFNNLKNIEALLEKDPYLINNSYNNTTFLDLAISNNNTNTAIVRYLLEKADLNSVDLDGNTALLRAIKNDALPIKVKLLAEHKKTDPTIINKLGFNALHEAVKNGNLWLIDAILKNPNTDINKTMAIEPKGTALHCAIFNNTIEILENLLKHNNIKVNAQDDFGNTALHLAIQKNDPTMVQELLNHKDTNPNIINNKGLSTLHIAVQQGNPAIVELLLKHHKININQPSIDLAKKTALHIAASSNNDTKILDMLLRNNNVNINAQNKTGLTPLHISVLKNKVPAIINLLNHKDIDLNIKNENGKTAKDIATTPHIRDLINKNMYCKKPIQKINLIDKNNDNKPKSRWLG